MDDCGWAAQCWRYQQQEERIERLQLWLIEQAQARVTSAQADIDQRAAQPTRGRSTEKRAALHE